MAVYLIDFENVTSAGISGIQRLSKEDKVYIFYTVNAANMSFAAHMNLLSSPAEVIYYNVTSGGKNALDFQLASFLGYLISNGEDKDFYIISNDKGYDHVKNFWERSGIAEGVTIHSAPSINRSLIPIEKPFTSKIQQAQGAQQTVAQQNGVSLEQLEQMKAETDKYTEQKKAAAFAKETAAKEANEGNTDENTENKKADTEKKTKKTEKAQTKSANDRKNTAKKGNETEVTEEKPVKRRGRPKKQATETSEMKTEKSAKSEEIPAKAEKADAKAAKANANKAKSTAKKPKTNSTKGKTSEKKGSDSDVLKNAIRPLLEKAKVKSEDEVTNVANYFKLADGKQQFYRNLITLYGMERGVEIYRVIRTEYTNLTKLVKQ
ncbi:MAG: hypothetical protein K2N71_06115 [Oscillospiraceae bacterium]|nr:hypothetical protein [Oscillospiraceae bacterium]